MRKSRVIGLGAYTKRLQKELSDYWVDVQTMQLIAYAQDMILRLGNDINSINTRNNMNDEGNLLDSLCWGVCYSGELKGSGFFREQVATKPSGLHAYSKAAILEGGRSKWKSLYNADATKARLLQKSNWSYESAAEPVNGHQLAEEYLSKAGTKSKKGQWLVFFAILAPYWGYWEEGHYNIFMRRFVRFNVMTWYYDQLKRDLSPAKARIHVHVEKYASKSLAASAKKTLRHPERFDKFKRA